MHISLKTDDGQAARSSTDRRRQLDSYRRYVEELGHGHSAPTVKQYLAAIRMIFDWLATGGVLPFNPANAVWGPKHVMKRGKTPLLAPDEARTLTEAAIALSVCERSKV